ncbi:hypothetical protein OG948_39485 (plasmid) [Embleya sp. NBC_00888]|uniref:hypothetical protein n=1 Tax=Embleya sp. NBC_00888 TaxID=2975960 RepID=UPI002F90B061|nr:hypothetical protein OG948_39485 [Embleya sp. NBC_00888]
MGTAVVVATPNGARTAVELRDAATGQVRKNFTADGRVTGETWWGKPAIVVRGQRVVPSDGLSAEKRSWSVDAYDERGEPLGRVELPLLGRENTNGAAIEDGWLIRTDDNRPGGSVTVLRAGDTGPGQSFSCASDCSFAVGGGRRASVVGAGEVPLLVDGTVFTIERMGTGTLAPRRIVAHDPASGARRWATDTVEKPAGADPKAYDTGSLPNILGSVDGRIAIAWDTKPYGQAAVLSLHDPATGRLVATGPTSPEGASTVLTDTTGAVAVLGSGGSNSRSTVWEPSSGRTLWQQAADEHPLSADGVVGGVLYGIRADQDVMNTRTPIAVDVRTKQVLAQGFDKTYLPTPIGDRFAVVSTRLAMFVFAVQPR